MTKRSTKKEVRRKIKELGYSVIMDFKYVSNKSKIHIMDSDGYKYYVSYGGICSRIGLARFHKSNPYTKYNINLFLKKNKSEIKV